MTNRERIDKMKEVLANSSLYEEMVEEIHVMIAEYTGRMASEYGYNGTEVMISLQEMLGLEEYTEEEIDREVSHDMNL